MRTVKIVAILLCFGSDAATGVLPFFLPLFFSGDGTRLIDRDLRNFATSLEQLRKLVAHVVEFCSFFFGTFVIGIQVRDFSLVPINEMWSKLEISGGSLSSKGGKKTKT